MAQEKLGQIGIGALGQHFAARFLKAFGQVLVHDVDRGKVLALEARGATAAASSRALAAESDIVLLSLPSPGAVRSVMLGDDGVLAGARPDTLVIDTSSIDPLTVETVHAAANARGVRYLEAPLTSAAPGSPGIEAARNGTFTVLIGGEVADFERGRPVLDLIGETLIHLGPAGSASVMKLISNSIAEIYTLAVAEGLAVAAAAGFSAERTLEVLSQSVARGYVLDEDLRPRVMARDFEPGFTVDLIYKDMRLAGELAQRLRVPMLLNGVTLEVFQALRAKGRGHMDHNEVVNLIAEQAGVDIHEPREREAD